MAGLTYRRVVLVAAAFLLLFYFLKGSGSSNAARPKSRPSSPQGHGANLPPSAPKDAQVPFSEMARKPLRTQLEYFFPYYPTDQFPGYIWQTWKYAPASKDFNDDYREFESTWSMLHPGFVHEVITDDMALHLLRHLYSAVPKVVEAYEALPLPILKADFFRYLILLARGGIYTDIDTAAIRTSLDWVPQEVPRESYGLVIGIEADPDREDWAKWYSRRIQFCQWTIQAKPGHPVLRELVAKITEASLAMRDGDGFGRYDSHRVVEFTGPGTWTDTIFDYFNNPDYFNMDSSTENVTFKHFTRIKTAKKVGDVVVLPITCFSPGVGQMGAGEDDDPMAFVKHKFDGTWKPESERHIGDPDEEQRKEEARIAQQKKEKEEKEAAEREAQKQKEREEEEKKKQEEEQKRQAEEEEKKKREEEEEKKRQEEEEEERKRRDAEEEEQRKVKESEIEEKNADDSQESTESEQASERTDDEQAKSQDNDTPNDQDKAEDKQESAPAHEES